MNFFKLPFDFDVDLLKKDLEYCQKQLWVDHYNKGDYEGNWEIIALRSHSGDEKNIIPVDADRYHDTELLSHCHYFKEVIDSLLFEKQSIRLMSLFPESIIKNHTDAGLEYDEGFFRLHIPILTEKEVIFYFDEKPVHMAMGECWYGNFNVIHRVEHKGTLPRIHLVIDGLRNEWTDNIFIKAGFDFTIFENKRRKERLKILPQIIKNLEAMQNVNNEGILQELKAELANGITS